MFGTMKTPTLSSHFLLKIHKNSHIKMCFQLLFIMSNLIVIFSVINFIIISTSNQQVTTKNIK